MYNVSTKVKINMGKKFIGIKEASELLGFSAVFLRKMAKNNIIPSYQPTGRKRLFDKDEIIEWVKNNKIEQNNEN